MIDIDGVAFSPQMRKQLGKHSNKIKIHQAIRKIKSTEKQILKRASSAEAKTVQKFSRVPGAGVQLYAMTLEDDGSKLYFYASEGAASERISQLVEFTRGTRGNTGSKTDIWCVAMGTVDGEKLIDPPGKRELRRQKP